MVSSIIQGITDFFMNCPLLKDGAFRVDALSDKGVEYTIETGIFDPIVKTYVNGDTDRIYQFSFGSREFYSMDRLQNIKNIEFYEQFANWIEEQSRNENFPEMPEKCYPQALTVLSPGYIFDGSMKNARYQIQLQLEYYKEA